MQQRLEFGQNSVKNQTHVRLGRVPSGKSYFISFSVTFLCLFVFCLFFFVLNFFFFTIFLFVVTHSCLTWWLFSSGSSRAVDFLLFFFTLWHQNHLAGLFASATATCFNNSCYNSRYNNCRTITPIQLTKSICQILRFNYN